MTDAAHIVAPGDSWDGLFGRFAEAGENDIYFDHRYVSLYASNGKRAEAFAYEAGDSLFFLPYLYGRVPEAKDEQFDFETAYGYSGPLSTDRDPSFLAAAWRAFDAHCAEKKFVAGLFRFHPLIENHRLAETGAVDVISERQSVFIDLGQNEDAVWQGYASDNRNRIRKSEKLGVRITAHDDIDSVRQFAELYLRRMSELEAGEEYFFDHAYFDNIAGFGADRFRVYLARVGEEIIGGALILLSGRFAHYHLSSTPREFQRFAANNLLRHSVVLDLLQGPYEKLHFGGGRTSSPEDSLLKFKRRFSKSLAQFHIGRYIPDPVKYETIRSAWRRNHPDKVADFGSLVLCYRYT